MEYDFYGEVRTAELQPGGADIPVTASNRSEYVQLYTRWQLEGSIASQFAAFRSGFLRVRRRARALGGRDWLLPR